MSNDQDIQPGQLNVDDHDSGRYVEYHHTKKRFDIAPIMIAKILGVIFLGITLFVVWLNFLGGARFMASLSLDKYEGDGYTISFPKKYIVEEVDGGVVNFKNPNKFETNYQSTIWLTTRKFDSAKRAEEIKQIDDDIYKVRKDDAAKKTIVTGEWVKDNISVKKFEENGVLVIEYLYEMTDGKKINVKNAEAFFIGKDTYYQLAIRSYGRDIDPDIIVDSFLEK